MKSICSNNIRMTKMVELRSLNLKIPIAGSSSKNCNNLMPMGTIYFGKHTDR